MRLILLQFMIPITLAFMIFWVVYSTGWLRKKGRVPPTIQFLLGCLYLLVFSLWFSLFSPPLSYIPHIGLLALTFRVLRARNEPRQKVTRGRWASLATEFAVVFFVIGVFVYDHIHTPEEGVWLRPPLAHGEFTVVQ